MAKLVFGMNQSLDGYVDHEKIGPPDAVVFRHFVNQVKGTSGMLYGRRMYEVMRYWDDDQPDWGELERDYATAWRSQRKWVISRTLTSAGPKATIVQDGIEAFVRQLKAEIPGEIEVAGPDLAQSLGDLGLVDEYRLYVHPAVLGEGKRFFAGSPPSLRFAGSDQIGESVIRLTYVPA